MSLTNAQWIAQDSILLEADSRLDKEEQLRGEFSPVDLLQTAH